MAFAVGHEMVCPLCRYLHKDQPFMNQESEDGEKLTSPNSRRSFHSTASTSTSTSTATSPHQRHTFSDRRRNSHSIATLHEHPTSGTVLSMMPSLFETSLGHGPAAGTIRTAPDGIFLKTSTWLLLYAMPFSVALCFLSFVLGKVETMWSKISCLIGAAICYMVCWALVVAIMNPDHEARAILERLNQFQETVDGTTGSTTVPPQAQALGSHPMQVTDSAEVQVVGSTFLTHRTRPQTDANEVFTASGGSLSSIGQNDATAAPLDSLQTPLTGLLPIMFSTWALSRYAVDLQQRVQDLAEILDDLPDMMAEW
ncbi:hypothetical protein BGZ70_008745 [Mortierella alpina]|uniref:Uncharacterized protein n=1 Tax=Mortierella alpina TaxID=64518 RepID=A0A9P6J3E7_MORAP|nr:hypothetical protein BGZ70_008745 [Mortierella alpina]